MAQPKIALLGAYLAAVVVLSTVVGSVALTGTVAADAQDLTVTNEGKKLQTGGALTFEVTDDADLSGEDIQVWVDENGNGVYDQYERNKTLSSADGTTLSAEFSNVDYSPGEYTLMAVENDTMNESRSPDSTDTFVIDNTSPSMRTVVAYSETDGTQAYGSAGETVVEVRFSEPLSDGTDGTSPSQGDVRITLRNGTVRTGTLNDGGTGDETGDRRVAVTLGSDIHPSDVAAASVVSTASFTDAAGNEVEPQSQAALVTTATVAEDGTNTTAWAGEVVVAVADTDAERIEMRGSRTGRVFATSTGKDSKLVAWDSEGWTTDQQYQFLFDGRTEPDFLLGDVSLNLSDLELTVEANDTQLTTADDLNATIDAKPPHRDVRVTLRNDEGATVASRVVTLNESGGARVTFGPQEEGTYSIEVEDLNTRITATSDTIEVVAVASTPTATPTPTTAPTPTATPTGTPPSVATPTPSATPTPTGTSSTSPTSATPSTPTATPDQAGAETPPTTATPSPTDTSQPGFGAALAALVLLGSVLVTRLRAY